MLYSSVIVPADYVYKCSKSRSVFTSSISLWFLQEGS